MPLQYLLTAEANARFRAAGRYDLVGTPGGQILGSLDAIRPVAAIMASCARSSRRPWAGSARSPPIDLDES
jgi:hypothetical protein